MGRLTMVRRTGRCISVPRGVALGGLATALLVSGGALGAPEPAPAAPAPADGGDVTVKAIGPGEAARNQEAAAPPEPAPEPAAPPDQGRTDAEKQRELEIAQALEGNSPVELPGETYYLIGARYRGIVVPKFMQNVFASGGQDVYVHAFGPEFGIRKNGFEINLSPWLAFYSVDDMAFKGKNDNVHAWELLSANLKLLYLTSDFLWSHEFTPQLALNYGVGVGLGFVFGDLYRNQSYPTGPGQDPADFQKCAGQTPGIPGEAGYDYDGGEGSYCDDSNNHYGNYTEPNWANGGSKPIVFPWLALQTGLRFKPSRSVVTRFDLGFGTSGFFFGLGVDYGL